MHGTLTNLHTCKDCGTTFEMSFAQEQWFIERGMHIPTRCESCRSFRKTNGLVEPFQGKPGGIDNPTIIPTTTQPTPVMPDYITARPVTLPNKNIPAGATKYHIFQVGGRSMCGSYDANCALSDVRMYPTFREDILCKECIKKMEDAP